MFGLILGMNKGVHDDGHRLGLHDGHWEGLRDTSGGLNDVRLSFGTII